MDKFKFIDLFCGIGGFHQAMADLGITPVIAAAAAVNGLANKVRDPGP